MDAKPVSSREGFRLYAKAALVAFVVGWVICWLAKTILLETAVSPLVRDWRGPPRPPFPFAESVFSAYLHVTGLGALLLSLPFVALASWALASPRSFETAKKSFPFFVAGSYVGELVALLLGQFVLLPALLHAQPGPFEPIRLSDYVALVFRVIAGTSMVFELAVVAAFVAFHRGATNSTTLDEPTSSARAKNTPR